MGLDPWQKLCEIKLDFLKELTTRTSSWKNKRVGWEFIIQLEIKEKGFTLIEVLVVLFLIAIIAFIAVPSVAKIIKESEEGTCFSEMDLLENRYEMYLGIEDIDHSDVVFSQFLVVNKMNACANECTLTYTDGEIQCSKNIDGGEDNGDGSVPYL